MKTAFVDLRGAANLIPGPSSTEMAIYPGYERAGWRGLIAGGVRFIVPALAWAYVKYGSAPRRSGCFSASSPLSWRSSSRPFGISRGRRLKGGFLRLWGFSSSGRIWQD